MTRYGWIYRDAATGDKIDLTPLRHHPTTPITRYPSRGAYKHHADHQVEFWQLATLVLALLLAVSVAV